jgi:hypothetical protein
LIVAGVSAPFDSPWFSSYRLKARFPPSPYHPILGEKFMGNSQRRTGRVYARPAVEQLEARQLLSVTVLPDNINLRGAQHGHGVFTVKIISDTQAGTDLLNAASRTFMVGSVTLTPVRTHTVDLNGDNVPDLILKFRRSDLATLTPGQQTLTVSAAVPASSSTTTTGGTGSSSSTTTTETATFNLFEPGNGGNGSQGHGHHGHSGKHGHGHKD